MTEEMAKKILNSVYGNGEMQRRELMIKILDDFGITQPGELVEALQYLDETGYFIDLEDYE